MVREEEKHLIRQCIDALREGIPGFKSRRPQMEMIAAVANTLSRCRAEDEQAGNGDHLAIVEAGTGPGKSFGALVPALVMAKSRQKRLVVSSSTVALQHQYAEKDAPSLQRLVQREGGGGTPRGHRFVVSDCGSKYGGDREQHDRREQGDATLLSVGGGPTPRSRSNARAIATR